jgi:hypothetical protein
LTGSAVAPAAATRAGRSSSSSPKISGSSWLSWPACGGRPAAAVTSPWPVPGSCSPAASCAAPGSSWAEPQCAISTGAAHSGPPIWAAPLFPPGSAGPSKPLAAPVPSPAAASSGLRAGPLAAAPGAASAQRPGSCPERVTRARPADAAPEPAAPATAITPPIAGPQRAKPGSTPGWPGWHTTQASSPRICRTTRRNIPLQRALPASCPKTTGKEITAAASSTPHYAEPGAARTLPGARSSRYLPGVPVPAADPRSDPPDRAHG